MQRLLKPLTVTFSRVLKLVWPYSRLQMRREQKKFVSLVPRHYKDTLRSIALMDNPVPGLINLAIEDTLLGNFSVGLVLPKICEYIKKTDIDLYWSYRLKSIDAKVDTVLQGHFLLKKLRSKSFFDWIFRR